MTTHPYKETYALDGPSSFSTLYHVPDWITQIMNERPNVDIDDTAVTDADNDYRIDSDDDQRMQLKHTLRPNPYGLRSKNKKKTMSDYETMAFVGLRDFVGIGSGELRRLYNYTHCEYQTFEAAINNRNVEYSTLMNKDEFRILYRIYGRVQGLTSWMDVCEELGFGKFFDIGDIKAFHHELSNVELRAKDGLPELQFFMQLIIFYWDRHHHALPGHSCTFAYFWMQCVIKVIKFISEFAVDQHVAVFSALAQWIPCVVTELSGANQQLCVQYENADGKHEQRWYSYFSPCLAPINFKYHYSPHRRNVHLPCIAAQVDRTLDNLAAYHLPVRNMRNQASKAKSAIPKKDWYYETNGRFTGPISLSMLFLACVEKQIDNDTHVKHAAFGTTTLKRLPHIVTRFKMHIQKCMRLQQR